MKALVREVVSIVAKDALALSHKYSLKPINSVSEKSGDRDAVTSRVSISLKIEEMRQKRIPLQ